MALSKLFEKARRDAVEAYLQGGVLLPRLHCLRGNEICATYILLHETDEWKQAWYRRILAFAESEKVDGFIDVFESWQATDVKPGQRPSTAPDRTEGVLMAGRQVTAGERETIVRAYDILRVGGSVDLFLNPATQPRNVDEVHAWFDPYLDKLMATFGSE